MSESVWTQPHSTEDVGDFVAAIRRLEGRTQTELAADAGVLDAAKRGDFR